MLCFWEVEHELQTVLCLTQKAIGRFESGVLILIETPRRDESPERSQGVLLAESGVNTSVEELQKLHDEFDIANAAATGLDVRGVPALALGCPFDLPFDGFDLVDFDKGEISAIDERFDQVQKLLSEWFKAGNRTRFDEHSSLPRSAMSIIVRDR